MVSLGVDQASPCLQGDVLTDHEVVVQRQSLLLRGVSPPSEKRFLFARTGLTVCFLVRHLADSIDKEIQESAQVL